MNKWIVYDMKGRQACLKESIENLDEEGFDDFMIVRS